MFSDPDSNDPGASVGMRKSESERFTATLSGKLTDSLDFNINATYHHYYRYIDGYDLVRRPGPARAARASAGRTAPAPRPARTAVCGSTRSAMPCRPISRRARTTLAIPRASPTAPNWRAGSSSSRSARPIPRCSSARRASAGGTGLTLPGGEVQFGVGAQYRRDTYSVKYGNNNNLAVNPCRESPLNGNLGACRPNQTHAGGEPAGDRRAGVPRHQCEREGVGRRDRDLWRVADRRCSTSSTCSLPPVTRIMAAGSGSTFDPQARVRLQATPWLAFRGGIGTTFRGRATRI